MRVPLSFGTAVRRVLDVPVDLVVAVLFASTADHLVVDGTDVRSSTTRSACRPASRCTGAVRRTASSSSCSSGRGRATQVWLRSSTRTRHVPARWFRVAHDALDAIRREINTASTVTSGISAGT